MNTLHHRIAAAGIECLPTDPPTLAFCKPSHNKCYILGSSNPVFDSRHLFLQLDLIRWETIKHVRVHRTFNPSALRLPATLGFVEVPGSTALTVCPFSPISAARLRVKPSSPALLAEYKLNFGKALRAPTELILIIRPGAWRCGRTACIIKIGARKLRSMTLL